MRLQFVSESHTVLVTTDPLPSAGGFSKLISIPENTGIASVAGP